MKVVDLRRYFSNQRAHRCATTVSLMLDTFDTCTKNMPKDDRFMIIQEMRDQLNYLERVLR